MTHPLLSDPFVAAEVERALEPYASSLGPSELAWARDQLAAMLQDDEHARRLLDEAYPRRVERSGEQLRPSAPRPNANLDSCERRDDGTTGGRR